MTDTTVRRNGQLSSCEPCRKAKVRCDHQRPICGRCARRGMSGNQCYYHPAPMSQRKPSSTPLSSYEPILTPAPTQSSRMPSSAVTSPGSTGMTSAASPPSEHLDRITGLVGMHGSLFPIADAEDAHNHRAYAAIARTGVAAPSHPVAVPPHLIDEGARILAFLADSLEDTEFLLDRYLVDSGEYIVNAPLVHNIVPGMVKMLQKLRFNPSQARLREMSRAIFALTPTPFKWPPSPAAGALQEALCPGVPRWEAIGIYAGTLVLFLASDNNINTSADGYQHQKSLRSSMARKAFDIALECEGFTHIQGQVNDLTLWLMCTATMASTWCFGDDSYCTWRSMSILSSMVIALTYHRPAQDNPPLPYYVVELRRRAVSLAHELDKGMATFVGRPPFFNRLYCSFEMPLDLPDSAIMGSLENFEAAKAKLDANGWNTDQRILCSARGRIMILICPHREQALELALGNQMADTERRANEILSSLTSTWEALPTWLRYETAQRDQLADSGNSVLSFLRLECLYTQFLLYKRIVNLNEKYRHQLIQTSHEIVSLVLAMLRKRTALVFHRNDVEWATALYAMPCAGVLLLELFRQIRQPQSQAVLNRSTIIKDMTALILCCDWLTEIGQGNYQIIRQAQSIFSRGLDQLLDNPNLFDDPATRVAAANAAATASSGSGSGSLNHHHHQHEPNAELTDADFAMLLPQDLEWSTWLESFGLGTDPWFDLAHQPQTDYAMEGVS